MLNNKILVRINDLKETEYYQKKGINNFLFPLSEFSIGYNTFSLNELKEISGNVFLLVNRILDNNDINKFKLIKEELTFTKGLFFEDVGVYQMLKDTKIPLIWNQNHFVISSKSINSWLTRVDSASLSNELTKDEIKYILDNASKKIVLPVFGLNSALYSRRSLLSNYQLFKNGPLLKKQVLKASDDVEFLAEENEYGTVFFYNKYFNYLKEITNFNDEKILYYYIDPKNISKEEVIELINGKEITFDNRFFNKKTIYKLEGK